MFVAGYQLLRPLELQPSHTHQRFDMRPLCEIDSQRHVALLDTTQSINAAILLVKA